MEKKSGFISWLAFLMLLLGIFFCGLAWPKIYGYFGQLFISLELGSGGACGGALAAVLKYPYMVFAAFLNLLACFCILLSLAGIVAVFQIPTGLALLLSRFTKNTTD